MTTSLAFPPVGKPVTIYLDGNPIRHSQNLRGLISHAYRAGVHAATIFSTDPNKPTAGEGLVVVEYKDGATCRVRFASFTVGLQFLRSRWQKWGLYAEVRNSDAFWSFI